MSVSIDELAHGAAEDYQHFYGRSLDHLLTFLQGYWAAIELYDSMTFSFAEFRGEVEEILFTRPVPAPAAQGGAL